MVTLDISVVILTYNEELHLRRCLNNVSLFAKHIFIIDSYSNDATLSITQEFDNVSVLQHKWENNHAKQFNWALKNAPITTKWVLRLDADEYLTLELIHELEEKLSTLEDDITGIIFKRRHIFMEKWMKRGIYPVKLLRCFQYGKGKCENKLMDEHILLLTGRWVEFNADFVDHNLNNISWFCQKHINYASREAAELLDIKYDFTGSSTTNCSQNMSEQAIRKRIAKHKYVKQPLFIRSFLYFCYRYFLKGACLDGKAGFVWTFIQGWWYRTLVDAIIYEIKKKCNNKEEMLSYLEKKYHISFEQD